MHIWEDIKIKITETATILECLNGYKTVHFRINRRRRKQKMANFWISEMVTVSEF